ncbi:hypothetical protein A5320_18140 [Rheinheimera sp. SA_1]|uniref:hypothetical protein n=1 Tax=Rheinheimera sp. SA_1 TaxID=1827365 RepID=UPI0007FC16B3|nr:hypothetical protein [Rheinheimera sp. SA_1]OBP13471.1 hypothetical protein A5320_18140 [Rheinheimera sp. SA_1]
MSDQQSRVSAAQAKNILQQAELHSVQMLRPPLWLNLLMSITSGVLIFSIAQVNDNNPWAFIAILAAVVLALCYGFYHYRSRLLGIKPKVVPYSYSSAKCFGIVLILFCLLSIGSRSLAQEGNGWVAYAGALSGAVLLLLLNHFYPAGKLGREY